MVKNIDASGNPGSVGNRHRTKRWDHHWGEGTHTCVIGNGGGGCRGEISGAPEALPREQVEEEGGAGS
eukprot:7426787-Prorocentrum_lima.AAC.1